MEQQLLTFINEDILADQADVTVGGDDELLVEGYIDSLGVMRLVSFIEERFGIAVPPQDITIENFRSVSVLSGYLQRRAEGGEAAAG